MCNLYTQSKSQDEIARLFRDLQMPLRFPEGVPNLQPRDIAITDPGPIVRRSEDTNGAFDLVVRRWSWPGPGGRPVYNVRSENRDFPHGRCLIVADGFYEFTAPADPKQKRKDRWLFTPSDADILGIAGFTHGMADGGEAFTMLTIAPGPDVAPYHGRQVAMLPPNLWRSWLDPDVAAQDLLNAPPAGALRVEASARPD